ncbi:MAG: hypothetical protein JWM12_1965 [Ilumatobacteraceae bacterium]|nr:hypothetical protein [Ilumatobacteraceae bacterium]
MATSTRVNRFELGLLADRSVDKAVALADLLELHEQSTPWPAVRLGDATLFFETHGRDWMPLHWVLGDLAALGTQFADAAVRLRRGESAIVRSAVDDQPVVAYFLFEPSGSDVVVSLFYPPAHLRYVYPTAPTRGAELYELVADHRAELLTRSPEHVNPYDILAAVIPGDELIDALLREVDRARQVVALIGNDADATDSEPSV